MFAAIYLCCFCLCLKSVYRKLCYSEKLKITSGPEVVENSQESMIEVQRRNIVPEADSGTEFGNELRLESLGEENADIGPRSNLDIFSQRSSRMSTRKAK